MGNLLSILLLSFRQDAFRDGSRNDSEFEILLRSVGKEFVLVIL